jgi:hypothetical protein
LISSSDTSFAGFIFRGDFLGLIKNVLLSRPKTFSP